MGARPRTSLLGLVVGVAIALVAPASAGAASTFGADLARTPSATSPCSSCQLTTKTRTSGAPETGSPISGVLTQVRLNYEGDGGDASFLVLRPRDAGSFENVGPEIAATLPATGPGSAPLSFHTRQPVEAGDQLGIALADSTLADPADKWLADGGECWVHGGAHSTGTTEAYGSDGCTFELLLEGTVEPDADGDGFGDETQDNCPSDPNPMQLDYDRDGQGNACDPPSADACGNVFVGSGRDDAIAGGELGDFIAGLGGNDRLDGLGFVDCLVGGRGGDTLKGDDSADALKGGAGDDRLLAGAGSNRLSGGSGDDVLRSRNREADALKCGGGEDVARVDRGDSVKACEAVRKPG